MRKLAERWLSFAEKDLLVARRLLDETEVFDMAAFHCQQAVEKSLKGLLALFDVDIPKIHDLSRLYSLCSATCRLDWDMELLDEVNEFYIETRYPIHEDQDPLKTTRAQLDQMVELAATGVKRLNDELSRLKGREWPAQDDHCAV